MLTWRMGSDNPINLRPGVVAPVVVPPANDPPVSPPATAKKKALDGFDGAVSGSLTVNNLPLVSPDDVVRATSSPELRRVAQALQGKGDVGKAALVALGIPIVPSNDKRLLFDRCGVSVAEVMAFLASGKPSTRLQAIVDTTLKGPQGALSEYGDLAMLAFFVNKAERLRSAGDTSPGGTEALQRINTQHTQLLIAHTRVLAAQEKQVAHEAAGNLRRAVDAKLSPDQREQAAQASSHQFAVLRDSERSKGKALRAAGRDGDSSDCYLRAARYDLTLGDVDVVSGTLRGEVPTTIAAWNETGLDLDLAHVARTDAAQAGAETLRGERSKRRADLTLARLEALPDEQQSNRLFEQYMVNEHRAEALRHCQAAEKVYGAVPDEQLSPVEAELKDQHAPLHLEMQRHYTEGKLAAEEQKLTDALSVDPDENPQVITVDEAQRALDSARAALKKGLNVTSLVTAVLAPGMSSVYHLGAIAIETDDDKRQKAIEKEIAQADVTRAEKQLEIAKAKAEGTLTPAIYRALSADLAEQDAVIADKRYTVVVLTNDDDHFVRHARRAYENAKVHAEGARASAKRDEDEAVDPLESVLARDNAAFFEGPPGATQALADFATLDGKLRARVVDSPRLAPADKQQGLASFAVHAQQLGQRSTVVSGLIQQLQTQLDGQSGEARARRDDAARQQAALSILVGNHESLDFALLGGLPLLAANLALGDSADAINQAVLSVGPVQYLLDTDDKRADRVAVGDRTRASLHAEVRADDASAALLRALDKYEQQQARVLQAACDDMAAFDGLTPTLDSAALRDAARVQSAKLHGGNGITAAALLRPDTSRTELQAGAGQTFEVDGPDAARAASGLAVAHAQAFEVGVLAAPRSRRSYPIEDLVALGQDSAARIAALDERFAADPAVRADRVKLDELAEARLARHDARRTAVKTLRDNETTRGKRAWQELEDGYDSFYVAVEENVSGMFALAQVHSDEQIEQGHEMLARFDELSVLNHRRWAAWTTIDNRFDKSSSDSFADDVMGAQLQLAFSDVDAVSVAARAAYKGTGQLGEVVQLLRANDPTLRRAFALPPDALLAACKTLDRPTGTQAGMGDHFRSMADWHEDRRFEAALVQMGAEQVVLLPTLLLGGAVQEATVSRSIVALGQLAKGAGLGARAAKMALSGLQALRATGAVVDAHALTRILSQVAIQLGTNVATEWVAAQVGKVTKDPTAAKSANFLLGLFDLQAMTRAARMEKRAVQGVEKLTARSLVGHVLPGTLKQMYQAAPLAWSQAFCGFIAGNMKNAELASSLVAVGFAGFAAGKGEMTLRKQTREQQSLLRERLFDGDQALADRHLQAVEKAGRAFYAGQPPTVEGAAEYLRIIGRAIDDSALPTNEKAALRQQVAAGITSPAAMGWRPGDVDLDKRLDALGIAGDDRKALAASWRLQDAALQVPLRAGQLDPDAVPQADVVAQQLASELNPDLSRENLHMLVRDRLRGLGCDEARAEALASYVAERTRVADALEIGASPERVTKLTQAMRRLPANTALAAMATALRAATPDDAAGVALVLARAASDRTGAKALAALSGDTDPPLSELKAVLDGCQADLQKAGVAADVVDDTLGEVAARISEARLREKKRYVKIDEGHYELQVVRPAAKKPADAFAETMRELGRGDDWRVSAFADRRGRGAFEIIDAEYKVIETDIAAVPEPWRAYADRQATMSGRTLDGKHLDAIDEATQGFHDTIPPPLDNVRARHAVDALIAMTPAASVAVLARLRRASSATERRRLIGMLAARGDADASPDAPQPKASPALPVPCAVVVRHGKTFFVDAAQARMVARLAPTDVVLLRVRDENGDLQRIRVAGASIKRLEPEPPSNAHWLNGSVVEMGGVYGVVDIDGVAHTVVWSSTRDTYDVVPSHRLKPALGLLSALNVENNVAKAYETARTALPDADRQRLDAILTHASDDTEKMLAQRTFAATGKIDDVEAFFALLHTFVGEDQLSELDLLRLCTADGVVQYYGNSCVLTVVQYMRARVSPLNALRLVAMGIDGIRAEQRAGLTRADVPPQAHSGQTTVPGTQRVTEFKSAGTSSLRGVVDTITARELDAQLGLYGEGKYVGFYSSTQRPAEQLLFDALTAADGPPPEGVALGLPGHLVHVLGVQPAYTEGVRDFARTIYTIRDPARGIYTVTAGELRIATNLVYLRTRNDVTQQLARADQSPIIVHLDVDGLGMPFTVMRDGDRYLLCDENNGWSQIPVDMIRDGHLSEADMKGFSPDEGLKRFANRQALDKTPTSEREPSAGTPLPRRGSAGETTHGGDPREAGGTPVVSPHNLDGMRRARAEAQAGREGWPAYQTTVTPSPNAWPCAAITHDGETWLVDAAERTKIERAADNPTASFSVAITDAQGNKRTVRVLGMELQPIARGEHAHFRERAGWCVRAGKPRVLGHELSETTVHGAKRKLVWDVTGNRYLLIDSGQVHPVINQLSAAGVEQRVEQRFAAKKKGLSPGDARALDELMLTARDATELMLMYRTFAADGRLADVIEFKALVAAYFGDDTPTATQLLLLGTAEGLLQYLQGSCVLTTLQYMRARRSPLEALRLVAKGRQGILAEQSDGMRRYGMAIEARGFDENYAEQIPGSRAEDMNVPAVTPELGPNQFLGTAGTVQELNAQFGGGEKSFAAVVGRDDVVEAVLFEHMTAEGGPPLEGIALGVSGAPQTGHLVQVTAVEPAYTTTASGDRVRDLEHTFYWVRDPWMGEQRVSARELLDGWYLGSLGTNFVTTVFVPVSDALHTRVGDADDRTHVERAVQVTTAGTGERTAVFAFAPGQLVDGVLRFNVREVGPRGVAFGETYSLSEADLASPSAIKLGAPHNSAPAAAAKMPPALRPLPVATPTIAPAQVETPVELAAISDTAPPFLTRPQTRGPSTVVSDRLAFGSHERSDYMRCGVVVSDADGQPHRVDIQGFTARVLIGHVYDLTGDHTLSGPPDENARTLFALVEALTRVKGRSADETAEVQWVVSQVRAKLDELTRMAPKPTTAPPMPIGEAPVWEALRSNADPVARADALLTYLATCDAKRRAALASPDALFGLNPLVGDWGSHLSVWSVVNDATHAQREAFVRAVLAAEPPDAKFLFTHPWFGDVFTPAFVATLSPAQLSATCCEHWLRSDDLVPALREAYERLPMVDEIARVAGTRVDIVQASGPAAVPWRVSFGHDGAIQVVDPYLYQVSPILAQAVGAPSDARTLFDETMRHFGRRSMQPYEAQQAAKALMLERYGIIVQKGGYRLEPTLSYAADAPGNSALVSGARGPWQGAITTDEDAVTILASPPRSHPFSGEPEVWITFNVRDEAGALTKINLFVNEETKFDRQTFDFPPKRGGENITGEAHAYRLQWAIDLLSARVVSHDAEQQADAVATLRAQLDSLVVAEGRAPPAPRDPALAAELRAAPNATARADVLLAYFFRITPAKRQSLLNPGAWGLSSFTGDWSAYQSWATFFADATPDVREAVVRRLIDDTPPDAKFIFKCGVFSDVFTEAFVKSLTEVQVMQLFDGYRSVTGAPPDPRFAHLRAAYRALPPNAEVSRLTGTANDILWMTNNGLPFSLAAGRDGDLLIYDPYLYLRAPDLVREQGTPVTSAAWLAAHIARYKAWGDDDSGATWRACYELKLLYGIIAEPGKKHTLSPELQYATDSKSNTFLEQPKLYRKRDWFWRELGALMRATAAHSDALAVNVALPALAMILPKAERNRLLGLTEEGLKKKYEAYFAFPAPGDPLLVTKDDEDDVDMLLAAIAAVEEMNWVAPAGDVAERVPEAAMIMHHLLGRAKISEARFAALKAKYPETFAGPLSMLDCAVRKAPLDDVATADLGDLTLIERAYASTEELMRDVHVSDEDDRRSETAKVLNAALRGTGLSTDRRRVLEHRYAKRFADMKEKVGEPLAKTASVRVEGARSAGVRFAVEVPPPAAKAVDPEDDVEEEVYDAPSVAVARMTAADVAEQRDVALTTTIGSPVRGVQATNYQVALQDNEFSTPQDLERYRKAVSTWLRAQNLTDAQCVDAERMIALAQRPSDFALLHVTGVSIRVDGEACELGKAAVLSVGEPIVVTEAKTAGRS